MNKRSFLIVLAAMPSCVIAGAHVSTSQTAGAIRFIGAVSQTTSAYIASIPDQSVPLAQTKQMVPLSDAQRTLSSDVLDYFASYASKDAKLVRMTYN